MIILRRRSHPKIETSLTLQPGYDIHHPSFLQPPPLFQSHYCTLISIHFSNLKPGFLQKLANKLDSSSIFYFLGSEILYSDLEFIYFQKASATKEQRLNNFIPTQFPSGQLSFQPSFLHFSKTHIFLYLFVLRRILFDYFEFFTIER